MRGLWQVYVVEPLTQVPSRLLADHRIGPRPVEIQYQEGDRVYVHGPLGEGERVVRNGLQRVVPGQLVRVLPDAPEQIAMEGL